MNATLSAAIAEGLATLTPAALPTGDLGYGSDLSCASDLTETMESVDPTSTRGIGEAIVRRWDCPRGGLPADNGKDSLDYGEDLRGYCNRGVTVDDVRAIASKLKSEAMKDDRVFAILVTVTPSISRAITTLRVVARVTPYASGPFTLILTATSMRIVIEAIGAAT